jgi:DegV family protein with EDD domain
MSVAIVTDSCTYLPPEIRREYGIEQVSLYVNRDGVAVRESEIGDLDAYYASIRDARELPTTSQPSIGDFLEVYEPLLDAGHQICSLHISGGISGTVRAAEQARGTLGDRADDVLCIDAKCACAAVGIMAMAASRSARDGADLAAVAARAGEVRESMRFWFAVDTLEYLRRGGRIGGAQAWLGTALKIKPILSLEEEITPFERVRTSRRAFERLIELLEEGAAAGYSGWAVQHIQAPDQAAALAERGREIFGNDPIVLSEIGPVIGTHVGPGFLGAGVFSV